MKRTVMTLVVVMAGVLAARGIAIAQRKEAPVEIQLMTYPEIYAAIHQQGKTTVLIVNGGIEQRGPHAVLGGHSLTATPQGVDIARKLGNALLAPVMPFSIAGAHLNEKTPGSVSIPGPVFAAINEAIVDSMVVNGFKNIVLMGEHGGGQKELDEVAKKTNTKYSPQGVHVFFCSDFYEKSQYDFRQWVIANHLPLSSHGGIPDTSLMMYLGADAWVRKDKMAAGDPVLPPGTPQNPNTPRVNNGILGDPRPSTPEIGKRYFDLRTKNAVAQIQALIAGASRYGFLRIRGTALSNHDNECQTVRAAATQLTFVLNSADQPTRRLPPKDRRAGRSGCKQGGSNDEDSSNYFPAQN